MDNLNANTAHTHTSTTPNTTSIHNNNTASKEGLSQLSPTHSSFEGDFKNRLERSCSSTRTLSLSPLSSLSSPSPYLSSPLINDQFSPSNASTATPSISTSPEMTVKNCITASSSSFASSASSPASSPDVISGTLDMCAGDQVISLPSCSSGLSSASSLSSSESSETERANPQHALNPSTVVTHQNLLSLAHPDGHTGPSPTLVRRPSFPRNSESFHPLTIITPPRSSSQQTAQPLISSSDNAIQSNSMSDRVLRGTWENALSSDGAVRTRKNSDRPHMFHHQRSGSASSFSRSIIKHHHSFGHHPHPHPLPHPHQGANAVKNGRGARVGSPVMSPGSSTFSSSSAPVSASSATMDLLTWLESPPRSKAEMEAAHSGSSHTHASHSNINYRSSSHTKPSTDSLFFTNFVPSTPSSASPSPSHHAYTGGCPFLFAASRTTLHGTDASVNSRTIDTLPCSSTTTSSCPSLPYVPPIECRSMSSPSLGSSPSDVSALNTQRERGRPIDDFDILKDCPHPLPVTQPYHSHRSSFNIKECNIHGVRSPTSRRLPSSLNALDTVPSPVIDPRSSSSPCLTTIASSSSVSQVKHQWSASNMDEFQAYMSHLADGVLLIDHSGHIRYSNPQASFLFGYSSPADLDGLSLNVLIPPKFRSQHQLYVNQFFSVGGISRPMGRPLEIMGWHRDGRLIPVDVKLDTLRVSTPPEAAHMRSAIFAIAFVRDVSSYHAIKMALEQSKREMELFLRSTNHEIRTAMNAIFGAASMLREGKRLDPDQEEALDILEAGAAHMHAVNCNVLDLSKIQAGKISLERVTLEIRTVVARVLKLNSTTAKRKNIDFGARVDDNVPARVIGDPTRLTQILQNLASNALKFTPDGGRVEIQVALKGITDLMIDGAKSKQRAQLEFRVADTGVGISRAGLQRLFRAFGQASRSTSRKYGGTGLGLSISQSLAKLMGGEITVKSIPKTNLLKESPTHPISASDSNGDYNGSSSGDNHDTMSHAPSMVNESNSTQTNDSKDLLPTFGLQAQCHISPHSNQDEDLTLRPHRSLQHPLTSSSSESMLHLSATALLPSPTKSFFDTVRQEDMPRLLDAIRDGEKQQRVMDDMRHGAQRAAVEKQILRSAAVVEIPSAASSPSPPQPSPETRTPNSSPTHDLASNSSSASSSGYYTSADTSSQGSAANSGLESGSSPSDSAVSSSSSSSSGSSGSSSGSNSDSDPGSLSPAALPVHNPNSPQLFSSICIAPSASPPDDSIPDPPWSTIFSCSVWLDVARESQRPSSPQMAARGERVRLLLADALSIKRSAFNLLVVDDTLQSRKITKKLLENKGFTSVLTAENGIEAIELVKQRWKQFDEEESNNAPPAASSTSSVVSSNQQPLSRSMTYFSPRSFDKYQDVEEEMVSSACRRRKSRDFDMILMDLEMPKMDGWTCVRQLRSMGYHGKVIAVTGHSSVSETINCKDAGMDDVTTKPLVIEQLLDIIAQTIIAGSNPPNISNALPPLAVPAQPCDFPSSRSLPSSSPSSSLPSSSSDSVDCFSSDIHSQLQVNMNESQADIGNESIGVDVDGDVDATESLAPVPRLTNDQLRQAQEDARFNYADGFNTPVAPTPTLSSPSPLHSPSHSHSVSYSQSHSHSSSYSHSVIDQDKNNDIDDEEREDEGNEKNIQEGNHNDDNDPVGS